MNKRFLSTEAAVPHWRWSETSETLKFDIKQADKGHEETWKLMFQVLALNLLLWWMTNARHVSFALILFDIIIQTSYPLTKWQGGSQECTWKNNKRRPSVFCVFLSDVRGCVLVAKLHGTILKSHDSIQHAVCLFFFAILKTSSQ